MKKRQKTLLTFAFLLCLSGAAGFFFWKRGTPFRQPYWSPNGQYYVQRYANWTPSSLYHAMPGQGSDAADGYIRLYDKSGKLIKERFATSIEYFNEPLWVGNQVYISMIAEHEPWILPTSSE